MPMQASSVSSTSTEPQVSLADLKQLKLFIQEKAKTCLHEPSGILKYRFVIPSIDKVAGGDDDAQTAQRSTVGYYLQMYDWDSCFFSQAQPYIGINGLARDIVANFLSLKGADGFIPRTVSPKRTWDSNDLCKPFLCQALLHEVQQESFKRPLPPMFLQDLDCWLDCFRRTRMHESGLFFWRNMLESGVDDNFSLIAPLDASKDENDETQGYPDGKLLAADLCSYLLGEYEAMQQMAERFGVKELVAKYSNMAKDLKQKVEDKLWNEQLGMYCNLNPITGNHITVRTWTNLTPVFYGLANSERAKRCIEENILNAEHFLRPFGMATVAISEPLYNQSRRGLYGRAVVSNWQGPVWILPNAMAVRALIREGYRKEAEKLALRALSAMSRGLKTHGTLYENYHADTGAPLWAPDFMSWNALAAEMIHRLD